MKHRFLWNNYKFQQRTQISSFYFVCIHRRQILPVCLSVCLYVGLRSVCATDVIEFLLYFSLFSLCLIMINFVLPKLYQHFFRRALQNIFYYCSIAVIHLIDFFNLSFLGSILSMELQKRGALPNRKSWNDVSRNERTISCQRRKLTTDN